MAPGCENSGEAPSRLDGHGLKESGLGTRWAPLKIPASSASGGAETRTILLVFVRVGLKEFCSCNNLRSLF